MTSARTRARMVARLRAKGIGDERVLAALGAVPRHLFLDEALASRAYEDDALPIGFGQTISHPYVVARMIEAVLDGRPAVLDGKPIGRALEVGTGCGYQAAVLARIFPEVYSIERIKGLHERARRNLLALRLANLRLAHGDGYAGLEQAAPFHSIIVAAAAPRIPEALVRQLADGGRMILPLAAISGGQRLVLIERSARGFKESELDPVRFVPMEAGKA
jgi:protein-L-isoaspartate(D-aspartate) O-methyltransferase